MAQVTVLSAVGTDISSTSGLYIPETLKKDFFTFLLDFVTYIFLGVLRVILKIITIVRATVEYVVHIIEAIRFLFFARNKTSKFLALNLAVVNVIVIVAGFWVIQSIYSGAQTVDYLVNVRHPPLSVGQLSGFIKPIYQADLFVAAYAPKKIKAVSAQIPYFTYRVQPGDSLYSIALKYGISVNTIIAANNIKNANYLKIGQILKIPTRDGVLYKVKKNGETLKNIAQKYKKDINLLAQVNNLKPNATLKKGTLVLIPGKPPKVSTTTNKTKRPTGGGATYLTGSYFTNVGGSCSYAIKFTGYGMQTTIVKPQVNYVSFIKYNPVAGRFRVSSGFAGYRWGSYLHPAVDYSAAYGTPIIAVADGVVNRIGYQAGGYGIYVKLYHPQVGLYTLYAHMSRRAAGLTVGSRVKAGQVIGYIGATGLAYGPHVHFEVIDRNRIRYNPACFR